MSIENRLHLESCVDAWRDLIDSFNVVLSFSLSWKETDWCEDRTNRGVVRVESVPRVVGREIMLWNSTWSVCIHETRHKHRSPFESITSTRTAPKKEPGRRFRRITQEVDWQH